MGGIVQQNTSKTTDAAVTLDDNNVKYSIGDDLNRPTIGRSMILSEKTESEKESHNFNVEDSRKSSHLVEQASFLVSHEGFCKGKHMPNHLYLNCTKNETMDIGPIFTSTTYLHGQGEAAIDQFSRSKRFHIMELPTVRRTQPITISHNFLKQQQHKG